MRSYRLLTPASRDLATILQFLQDKSALVAERFLNQLDRRLELLAQSPETGFLRPEFGQSDLRFVLVGSCLVAYHPGARPLAVLAIVHRERDLATLIGQRL